MLINNIPEELIARTQWVCWQHRARNGSAKGQKIPLNPETGQQASVSDSTTWGSFETARAYHELNPDTTDGIGFVLTASDPFVGVDLDNCVENRSPKAWAGHEVLRLDSYTEFSPSGTGLHVIVEGTLPGTKNRTGNVEVYDRDRFFTVTGDHFERCPTTVEPRQEELEAFYAAHLATESLQREMTTGLGDAVPATGSEVLSDEELLDKAMNSVGGEDFKRLWNGDISKFPSQSEADLSLSNRLTFYSAGNWSQIDRLFRKSGLMRPKWDEPRGERTYGEATISKALMEVDNYYDPNYGQESSVEPHVGHVTINEVKRVVLDNFGRQTWYALEAVLSAHAALLLEAGESVCLLLEGASGSGKTTVLRLLDDGDETMFYRSDDVTPAAFVSHDASKSEEELKKIDLLPRAKHKTLLVRDMATWFAGDEETISKRLSVTTYVFDGDGYVRDSGSHGRRGYMDPDYRFNFVGATTPISDHAWRVMGNTGNRFMVIEVSGTTDSKSAVRDVTGGASYRSKLAHNRAIIRQFLHQLWDETGGFASVDWNSEPDPELLRMLEYFTDVIRHGRAPINDDAPLLEGPHRVATSLWTIAKGHALLHGRRHVTMEDMDVLARIALSTIPQKRRPVVRSLLNPENDRQLTAGEVERLTGVSRPTAHKRMEQIARLGFGNLRSAEGDGRNTKVLELRDKFIWPESLDFPEF